MSRGPGVRLRRSAVYCLGRLCADGLPGIGMPVEYPKAANDALLAVLSEQPAAVSR